MQMNDIKKQIVGLTNITRVESINIHNKIRDTKHSIDISFHSEETEIRLNYNSEELRDNDIYQINRRLDKLEMKGL